MSVTQTGGSFGTADTTGLTLTFNVDPQGLTVDQLTLQGAEKGTLSGSGTTRTLSLGSLGVANGQSVSVTVGKVPGFQVKDGSKDVTVFRLYHIGDTGPAGGLIFYDKGSSTEGWRFLEASPADLATDYPWRNETLADVPGARGSDLGTRRTNSSNLVLAMGNTGLYAAKLCEDYSLGSYDDWFLPSLLELDQMHDNLYLSDLGSFSMYRYWSSTQYGSDPSLAYCWSFGNDSSMTTYTNQSLNLHVRAARMF